MQQKITRGRREHRASLRKFVAIPLAALSASWNTPPASGYAFNQIVPDVRQPAAISGGSACPVRAHQLTAAGSIAIRWSTALNANPATILTQSPPGSAQLTELEQVIVPAVNTSFTVRTRPPS